MKMVGRIAVVTGAGRGLGEAYARRLAEEGARVAVTDVDLEGIDRVATEIGDAALPFPLDVTSWDSVRAAAAAIEDALGPVDALVNNAGIHRLARSEELPEEWWDQIIDVNLSGTWRCSQVFGRRMVELGRGAIVNIGSVYSEVGNEGRIAYAATKTGVIGITRVLGVEWAPMGVRVNAIEPGYIDTPMVQVSLSSTSGVEQVLDRIPLGYLGSADEVARAVAFLLSDEASYITGATLRVDGGHLSYGGFPGVKSRTPSLDDRA